MKKFLILGIVIILYTLLFYHRINGSSVVKQPSDVIWKVRSIDTMKSSRDKAREQLNNSSFDESIEKELSLIKETGANYVAIGTPYDSEFLPYLKRWVGLARANGLNVWFRGNWSNWEGWFEYPKNLTPEQHLSKTRQFILENKSLFEDGDIFDSCPECENSESWKQPDNDAKYNEFIRAQALNNKEAFASIEKKVYWNYPSIIGGRAKEVLNKQTVDSLDRVVTIDHYVKDVKNMSLYIDYFKDSFDAKVLVSEFGAPIPDMNGPMNEFEQASFIKSIYNLLYLKKDQVIGVNYYVSYIGTTPILNSDYSKKEAYEVIKDYYSPSIIKGNVKNTLGENLKDAPVSIKDGISTITNDNGDYTIVVPPGEIVLQVGGGDLTSDKEEFILDNTQKVYRNFILEPSKPSSIYKLRKFINKIT